MFPSRQQARTWARGLGWFSVALGAIELLAGRRHGVREIVNGVALLNTREPGPWMWARVVGDATDLATLASGGRRRDGRFDSGTAIALGAVAGVAALDLMVARSLTSSRAAAHADYSRRSGLPLRRL